ncbi:MAG TPA: hypothetical protein VMN60_13060 [Longimicrobiales bacterium]|nr:hypothetical protein [Longimicrobiales bacterium]
MRSGGKQAVLVALAALVASLCARDVSAQVLVTADQDLSFGLVTPGVPAQVLTTDVANRAKLTVQGRGRYRISFTLPSELTGPGGQQIPLTFGATDGRVEIRNRIETFDPVAGHEFRINPADVSAQIYLGARATPGTGTKAGTYSATIVMMVVQTGT